MCANIHPRLHPKLANFSIFYSFHDILSTNETTQTFLQELKLIPSPTSIPPNCCGLPMKTEKLSASKLGWIWRCSTKATKKKGIKFCRKSINPTENTFFEGTKCKINLQDIVAILICFVLQMKVTEVIEHLRSWRHQRGDKELSCGTVVDYYSYYREIAEIISSHHVKPFGGEDKTVQIDETFLTKRKYHRGRLTEQMSIIVLGIYCKEDKTGIFFKVDGKSKRDLWPYIKKFVDPKTSRICTDSAKQYHGVENVISSTCTHHTTNHSIAEFVAANDSTNTINDLECQNKLLKKAIVSRKNTAALYQYMALYYYRKNILEKQYQHDHGSQIMQFLEDVARVYPGWINGEKKDILTLKNLEPLPQDINNVEDLLLESSKYQHEVPINEEFNFEDSSDDDTDIPSFNPL